MIRPVLTELLLFLTPFAVYAAFLWATRAGVLHPESWPTKTVIALTVLSLILVVVSSVYYSEWSGAPPGSTYVPAHVEDGKFVPGQTR
jgi:Family of unknown function (DUF6111)